MKLSLLFTVVLLQVGCSTVGSQFSNGLTNENILKIKSGMSSEEVVKMFGYPHGVRETTCGGNSPWNCTIWSYEDEWTDKEATFFFTTEKGKKILNSFDVEK
ncbi:MAG: hypothetical protein CME64_01610 [Halobacteriovoraceae bacterium]|nr:hypothetical protein [Halobacteriovoraceae bacterium]